MQINFFNIIIFLPKQKLWKIPGIAINPPLANRSNLFATMPNIFQKLISVDLKSELLLFQQEITKDYLRKIPGNML